MTAAEALGFALDLLSAEGHNDQTLNPIRAALREEEAKSTPIPVLPFILYLPTDDPLRPATVIVRDEKTFRQAINLAVVLGMNYANGWYQTYLREAHGDDNCPRPDFEYGIGYIDRLNGALPPGEELSS